MHCQDTSKKQEYCMLTSSKYQKSLGKKYQSSQEHIQGKDEQHYHTSNLA